VLTLHYSREAFLLGMDPAAKNPECTLLLLSGYADAREHSTAEASKAAGVDFAHVVAMDHPFDRAMLKKEVTSAQSAAWIRSLDRALDEVYEDSKGVTWERDLYVTGQVTLPLYFVVSRKLMQLGGFRRLRFVFFPFQGGEPVVYTIPAGFVADTDADQAATSAQAGALRTIVSDVRSPVAHFYVDLLGYHDKVEEEVPRADERCVMVLSQSGTRVQTTPENIQHLLNNISHAVARNMSVLRGREIYVHFTGPAPLVLATGFLFTTTVFAGATFHGVNVNASGAYSYVLDGGEAQAAAIAKRDRALTVRPLSPPTGPDPSGDHEAAGAEPVPKRTCSSADSDWIPATMLEAYTTWSAQTFEEKYPKELAPPRDQVEETEKTACDPQQHSSGVKFVACAQPYPYTPSMERIMHTRPALRRVPAFTQVSSQSKPDGCSTDLGHDVDTGSESRDEVGRFQVLWSRRLLSNRFCAVVSRILDRVNRSAKSRLIFQSSEGVMGVNTPTSAGMSEVTTICLYRAHTSPDPAIDVYAAFRGGLVAVFGEGGLPGYIGDALIDEAD